MIISSCTSTKLVDSIDSADAKLCIATSVSSINITIWYNYDDKIHHILPNKNDSDTVSNMIIEAKDRLIEYKERQSTLGEMEQDVLRRNSDADEEIIFATVGVGRRANRAAGGIATVESMGAE